jgi:hypothetical protein
MSDAPKPIKRTCPPKHREPIIKSWPLDTLRQLVKEAVKEAMDERERESKR